MLKFKELCSNGTTRFVINLKKDRNDCVLKEMCVPKSIHTNQQEKQEKEAAIEFEFTIYNDQCHSTEKNICSLIPDPTRSTYCVQKLDNYEVSRSKNSIIDPLKILASSSEEACLSEFKTSNTTIILEKPLISSTPSKHLQAPHKLDKRHTKIRSRQRRLKNRERAKRSRDRRVQLKRQLDIEFRAFKRILSNHQPLSVLEEENLQLQVESNSFKNT